MAGLRISGINSGMDTEAMVKAMNLQLQARYDKKAAARQKLEWQNEAYQDINSKLRAFREKYMSVLSEDNVFNSATFNTMNVTSSSTSGAIVATATNQAVPGVSVINKVDQIATGALARSGHLSMPNSSGASTVGLDVNASLKDLATSTRLNSVNGSVEFSINGETFKFSEEDSLQHVINTVNSNSKAGVKMAYSTLTDSITVESKETGHSDFNEKAQVDIKNISGNLFATGQTADSLANSVFKIYSGVYQNGQNAEFTINGQDVESASNTFEDQGVKYTLYSTTNEATTFSVSRDTKPMMDKIQGYVDALNEILGTLTAKVGEKVQRDYQPLTEEQKAEMTETQIKAWEDKSKSGLLRNDSQIKSLVSEIKMALVTKIGDTGMSMADIGITTGNYFTEDPNKIVIDKTKLAAAMEKNPDLVTEMFTAQGDTMEDRGLFTRYNSMITSYETTNRTTKIQSNTEAMARQDKDLTALSKKLVLQEERYWAQFAAMEQALGALNSQKDSLLNMLGLGSSS